MMERHNCDHQICLDELCRGTPFLKSGEKKKQKKQCSALVNDILLVHCYTQVLDKPFIV